MRRLKTSLQWGFEPTISHIWPGNWDTTHCCFVEWKPEKICHAGSQQLHAKHISRQGRGRQTNGEQTRDGSTQNTWILRDETCCVLSDSLTKRMSPASMPRLKMWEKKKIKCTWLHINARHLNSFFSLFTQITWINFEINSVATKIHNSKSVRNMNSSENVLRLRLFPL